MALSKTRAVLHFSSGLLLAAVLLAPALGAGERLTSWGVFLVLLILPLGMLVLGLRSRGRSGWNWIQASLMVAVASLWVLSDNEALMAALRRPLGATLAAVLVLALTVWGWRFQQRRAAGAS